ncbi:MAG: hypothetical protein ACTSRC_19445 [Candidatus Helarchaeota archaeon]
MQVWVTTVGWQPFAVINPIWAACFKDEFIPEKVVLLNNGYKNEKIRGNVAIVMDWVERILVAYGVETPFIEPCDADEDDIMEFRRIFEEVLQKHQMHQVAIDMTPGRKFMSSIAMAVGFKKENRSFVQRLYYLHLWVQEYQNYPFIKIPLKSQRLIDLLRL